MLVFSFSFVYQNLPQDPIALRASNVVPEAVAFIEYGATPVFAEKF